MKQCVLCLLLLLAVVGAVAAGTAAYRLAAGDKITVSVLKHDELSGAYTIPPDGVIDVPRVGRIAAAGKSTEELAAQLKEKFTEFLKEPSVSVTLAEARVVNAFVLGSVAKPGQFPITPTTRVTELLAAAGDLVGERAELTARLIRGKTILPIDLPAALGGKNPEANPLVLEGDLLWVETPEKLTVVVSGPVKNPGAVKLKQGGTLVDALAAAGDVMERPEKLTITLQRGTVKQTLAWNDVKTSLKDGDIVLVERLPVAQIYVNGQVKTPGTFELPEGAGVLEALTLAGGTLDTAALNLVTILQKGGSMRQINLAPALVHGQVRENPKLAAGDTVIVPQITDQIVVLGDVNRPGALLMSPERPMTVLDAIGLAGGQTNKAKLTQVSVIRTEGATKKTIVVNVNDILKKKKYDNNIALQPFDVVYVPGATKLGLGEIIQSAYYVMVGVRP